MTDLTGGRRTLALLAAGLAVAAVAAAVAGPALAALQGPSGDKVLDRVEQRYERAETVTGIAAVTATNESATMTATVEFAAADPNSSRVIVTSENRTYRAGTNGTVAWAVGPDGAMAWDADALEDRSSDGQNGAVTPGLGADAADSGPAIAEARTDLLTRGTPGENATATLTGTEMVDGTPAYRLALEPTGENRDANATLWVAREDYRILRSETTDGTNRTVVDVRETQFNVSIHESTFQPPTDRVAVSTIAEYETFDAARANATLPLPQLGGEATFEGATVASRGNETVVAQRYLADGENVTVVTTTATDRFAFENATAATVDGRSANVTTVRGRTVVAWTEDGVTTAVAVDGSTERALALARSLE
ncbi:LolA family protein [Halomicrobium salinisoli]|uniref:LolA family protein n=1 Tax=Halomicrobium salinisoli TaxID=2878391 RepID=UPI001CF0A1FE|nr:DUF2092 domain-containing protein [Halomicrobium salinisoli]